MGTKFWEVACSKHGNGDDGEYCGGNDTQLGRTNIFHHEASGGSMCPARGSLTSIPA
jgi:hypothetical protein